MKNNPILKTKRKRIASFQRYSPAGFTLVELLVVIAIMAALAALSSPIIIRQIARARSARALNNAHDVAIGMYSFHNNYGTLPSNTTATRFGTATASANDYFEQLIVTAVVQVEKSFYVRTDLPGSSPAEPDELLTPGNALAPGENVWAYFIKTTGQGTNISASHANTPVMATPLTVGGAQAAIRADFKSFGGQAVTLRIDKSAVVNQVNFQTSEIINPEWGLQIGDYTAVLQE